MPSTEIAISVSSTDHRTSRALDADGMHHDFVLASMTAQRTRERLDSAARYRLAKRAIGVRRRRLAALDQAPHERGLAGVLQAVRYDADQPHGEGDGGIPGAVDNPIKVAVSD